MGPREVQSLLLVPGRGRLLLRVSHLRLRAGAPSYDAAARGRGVRWGRGSICGFLVRPQPWGAWAWPSTSARALFPLVAVGRVPPWLGRGPGGRSPGGKPQGSVGPPQTGPQISHAQRPAASAPPFAVPSGSGSARGKPAPASALCDLPSPAAERRPQFSEPRAVPGVSLCMSPAVLRRPLARPRSPVPSSCQSLRKSCCRFLNFRFQFSRLWRCV